MTALDDAARQAARRYGVNPDEFIRRVRSARSRRIERAARPVKRCGTCGEHLPAQAFAEDTREADHLKSTCKSCDAQRQRDRRASRVAGA
ncbi:hypothetical protein Acy02nite_68300 [Actinoplanes cyaneus]|uniref:Uncharacterized protein n=1 Tax=Actinoplanes cyaneus TaxID=52696 RepID=A0A919INL6_9ACTN|nr:hypothetical protein Acy02nite_68300 [Actinoplanes cyaneus]